MFNFLGQLDIGKNGERQVDKFFSRWYKIENVSLDTEIKKGYDRIFTDVNGKQTKVEIKFDTRTEQTGNLFLEDKIVYDYKTTSGWIVKSQADILIYTTQKRFLLFYMQNLKEWFIANYSQYQMRRVPNNGFYGTGYLVPLKNLKTTDSFIKELTYVYN